MKLKEWLTNLNEQVKQTPVLLELEIIAAKDDEGNGYNYVNYTASTGLFDGEDFYPSAQNNKPEDNVVHEIVICLN